MYLSLNQQKFVDRRIKHPDETPEVSAVEAGYTGKNLRETGYRLLRQPAVMAAIEIRRKMGDAVAKIDKSYLLAGFNEIYVRCMQEGEIFEEIDGELVSVGVRNFKPKEATTAIVMMAKMLGLMVDKVEVKDESGAVKRLTTEIESKIAEVYGKKKDNPLLS
jgi:phage terminase small subunit